jgi:hypothetical protein
MEDGLIRESFDDLEGAVGLLAASLEKYRPYRPHRVYTPDELEYYDSWSFRFEKTVEIYLHFFRALELHLFADTAPHLRDRLLRMEKLGLVNEVGYWMEARLLRNKVARAYLPEKLAEIYDEMLEKSRTLVDSLGRARAVIERELDGNGGARKE